MRFGYLRYFLGLLIAIGLIIALIVLLFQGGNKTKTPTPKSLTSYADTSAVVRMTIDGPVTAPQNHNRVVITIGRDQATFQNFQGYDGTVVASKSYDNTLNSYNTFLHAIGRSGFTLGNTDPKLVDSTGYCPLGQVYTFELIDGDKQVEKFWTTNCGGTKTFNGNVSVNMNLFENQIPDYNTLIQNITL